MDVHTVDPDARYPYEIRDRGVAVVRFGHDGTEYVTDQRERLGRHWDDAVAAAKRLPAERAEKAKQRRRS